MAEEIIKLINGEPAHNYGYNRNPVSCLVTALRMMMEARIAAVGEQGVSVVP